MRYRYTDASGNMVGVVGDDDAFTGAFIPRGHRDWPADIEAWAPSLADERREAKRLVEQAVSRARVKYAASPEHQALIYDIKLSEAQAYVAAGRPADTSAYVMLTQSAAGAGRSVSDEADVVLARGVLWLQLAAATERLRIAANAAIDAEADASGIEATRIAYVAQLDAL
jgi:hypothetical protein